MFNCKTKLSNCVFPNRLADPLGLEKLELLKQKTGQLVNNYFYFYARREMFNVIKQNLVMCAI